MEKTTWPEKTKCQKAASIGIILGIFLGTALLACAVSSYFTSGSLGIGNSKGSKFTLGLTEEVKGIEVLPGTEQTVKTSIMNTGTEKMHVFVRLDISTTAAGSPVYAFTASGWDAVGSGTASRLSYAYGRADDPAPLNPGESAELNGMLRVAVTAADFMGLSDEDFTIAVKGRAVGGPESEGTGEQLHAEYPGLGGD